MSRRKDIGVKLIAMNNESRMIVIKRPKNVCGRCLYLTCGNIIKENLKCYESHNFGKPVQLHNWCNYFKSI